MIHVFSFDFLQEKDVSHRESSCESLMLENKRLLRLSTDLENQLRDIQHHLDDQKVTKTLVFIKITKPLQSVIKTLHKILLKV